MDAWETLSKTELKDKKKHIRAFIQLYKKIESGRFELKKEEKEKKNHFEVTEENRVGGWFVHIVPKETYSLFKQLQTLAPNSFLGFSVVAGKQDEKEIRVSCFGVKCNELGLALAKTTKRTRSYRLWKKEAKQRKKLCKNA